MKLIKCHIENFGKLSDFTYDFTDGCNTVCEENGWGKSTLAAFLRVMLFGFRNEGKRDPLENERKRYSPWQKGVYGGELQFESEGKQYSVRRTFGSKSAEDEFQLTDTKTNLPCRDFTQNLGEELFRIDAGSFERTIFISQNDCETFVTDGINAKIGNLAENTDDINNFETADKRLNDLLNSMSPSRKTGNLAENTDDINNFETADKRLNDLLNSMSPSRKTGSLRQSKDRITELKTQIRNGQEIQNTMESIDTRKKAVIEEREKLSAELTELQERQKKLGIYKDQQAKKEKYLDLRAKMAQRQQTLKEAESYFNGVIPKGEELREKTAICNQGISVRKAMEIYCLTEEEQAQCKDNFPMADNARLEEKYAEAQELESLESATRKNALSGEESRRLEELSGYFAEGMPQEAEIDSVKNAWTNRNEGKSLLQAKEIQRKTLQSIQAQEDARCLREQEEAGKRKKMLLLFGILLALGGCAVILLGQGVIGGVLIVLGIAAVAAALLFTAGRSKVQTGENTELSYLEQEMEELETQVCIAEGQIEDFCTRWGLREGLELTSWLVELQNKRKDYEALLERQKQDGSDEKTARIAALQKDLQQFFAEYGEVPETQNYLAALHELAGKCRQRQLLLEKQKKYLQQKQKYEALEEQVKDYFVSLQLIPEEHPEEQLAELESHRKDYEKELQEYRRIEQEIKAFEAKEDIPALLALKVPEGEESLESLADEMQVLSERMEERFQTIDSYQKQLSDLQESWDNVENMQEELEALQEKTEEGIKQYELLGMTKNLLEQAKSSFTAKYTEPVMQGFRKYYRILTGTECENYQMDANTRLQVVEGNMPRDIGYLSLGNRDLIGICMRLALVEAMYEEQKPFLILDDPFVNLDENRTKGAMRFLTEIAKEYQVIYFTCHGSRE